MPKKIRKGMVRSALTGKIVNGKEVILTEEAEEYIKKIGYVIMKPKDKSFKKFISEFEPIFKPLSVFIAVLLFFPLISAASALYTFDFSEWGNRIIALIVFAIAGVMYYKQNYLFSGTLILIMGILMAFNSINLIVSLFIMAVGIFILTQDGRE